MKFWRLVGTHRDAGYHFFFGSLLTLLEIDMGRGTCVGPSEQDFGL